MNATEHWNTATEMDHLADQHAAAHGEQSYDAVATRDFANRSRVAALLAEVGGVVDTMEGWVLAPHPLMVRCDRTAVSVTDVSTREFTAPVSDLAGTTTALLRLAAEAARACLTGTGRCDDCGKWAASLPI